MGPRRSRAGRSGIRPCENHPPTTSSYHPSGIPATCFVFGSGGGTAALIQSEHQNSTTAGATTGGGPAGIVRASSSFGSGGGSNSDSAGTVQHQSDGGDASALSADMRFIDDEVDHSSMGSNSGSRVGGARNHDVDDVSDAVDPHSSLPEGWLAVSDPRSGNIHYANATTGQSSWEMPNPDGSSIPDPVDESQSRSNGGNADGAGGSASGIRFPLAAPAPVAVLQIKIIRVLIME
jgi:WW domain